MTENYFSGSKFVKELKSSDFENEATWKLKDKKCCAILFYAPWCPHCKAMKETWEQLGQTASFFRIYAYNCEENKSHLEKLREDTPNLVEGYPTMIVYKSGNPSEKIGQDTEQRKLSNLVKACMRICKD